VTNYEDINLTQKSWTYDILRTHEQFISFLYSKGIVSYHN